MTAKSNHQVNIVRIPEIEKHPNADSLGIVRFGGYQVVVKLGDFKTDDLAVFIQPDSVVPEQDAYSFLWKDRVAPGCPVPDKYRRITVRRFRKEWSEGLLLSLERGIARLAFPDSIKVYAVDTWMATGLDGKFHLVHEGDDVAEILGVTHYDPPEPGEVQRKEQFRRWPRSLRGWWYFLLFKLGIDSNWPTGGENERGPKNPPPVYDVEALKNYKDAFVPGESVIVTEKIHGSNMRCLFDGKKFYVGSRKLWKSEKSDSIWRRAVAVNPWIERWCRDHPGYTLYGEVVPTQTLTYGYTKERPGFFAFDVLSPDGAWLRPQECGVAQVVPILVNPGPFSYSDLAALADGPSLVPGAKHLREGIVIRPVKEREVRNLGRLHLKIVSNCFLEKDK